MVPADEPPAEPGESASFKNLAAIAYDVLVAAAVASLQQAIAMHACACACEYLHTCGAVEARCTANGAELCYTGEHEALAKTTGTHDQRKGERCISEAALTESA